MRRTVYIRQLSLNFWNNCFSFKLAEVSKLEDNLDLDVVLIKYKNVTSFNIGTVAYGTVEIVMSSLPVSIFRISSEIKKTAYKQGWNCNAFPVFNYVRRNYNRFRPYLWFFEAWNQWVSFIKGLLHTILQLFLSFHRYYFLIWLKYK